MAVLDNPSYINLLTGYYTEGRGYSYRRPYGTHDWLLIYTVNGAGRFGHRGGELVTSPGDLVLIKPGIEHDYGVTARRPKWDLLWTHFQPRPHWLPWLDWPEIATGILLLSLRNEEARERIAARFFDAHRLATSGMRHGEDLAMNALEEVLLLCDIVNPRSEYARLDERVRRAVEYICGHLEEKLDINRLANITFTSESRLAHLFREQMGTTPQHFIQTQRIMRARQLLETTPYSIHAIAANVGFESSFYFSMRFKKATGFSPTKYRQHANSM